MFDQARGLHDNVEAFVTQHGEAATSEGWGMWTKDLGGVAIERIDDPDETPNHLPGDDAAWALVVNGTGAHHIAALQILSWFDPVEATFITNYVKECYEH